MTKDHWFWQIKVILGLFLAAAIYGFFYFETSNLLNIIVAIIAVVTYAWAIFQKTEVPAAASKREIAILFTLYLGFYSLYNLLYGVGAQLALVMLAVWLLVSVLFIILLILDKINTILAHPLFWTFSALIGLIILEIFLSLSFWPIDPKIKSLILVVIFYLTTNLIYLYTHNMLKFKKIIGFLIVSFLILGLFILSLWLSLKGG